MKTYAIAAIPGDGIGTDIRGGIGEGLDTLFITGGLDADKLGSTPEEPDPELLKKYFQQHETTPLYYMNALR